MKIQTTQIVHQTLYDPCEYVQEDMYFSTLNPIKKHVRIRKEHQKNHELLELTFHVLTQEEVDLIVSALKLINLGEGNNNYLIKRIIEIINL